MSFSQNKDSKLVPLEQKDLIHFSLVDKCPFKNNCDKLKDEEKISCLQNNLRAQIKTSISKDIQFNGELYVWFTVTKKGEIVDIHTKAYPSSDNVEEEIVRAVGKLSVNAGEYKGTLVNTRCYTRVFPESF